MLAIKPPCSTDRVIRLVAQPVFWLQEVIDKKIRNYTLPQNEHTGGEKVDNLNIVFIGRTGNGKSTTANTMIGKKLFEASKRATGVTQKVNATDIEYKGRKIR